MSTDPTNTVPDRLRSYYRELVVITQREFGPALEAVYATGSVALGDWVPSSSDVDIAVIAKRPAGARPPPARMTARPTVLRSPPACSSWWCTTAPAL